jgi:hypothetical protein
MPTDDSVVHQRVMRRLVMKSLIRFHCDDAGGGRGSGLTRCFTGLVPLP